MRGPSRLFWWVPLTIVLIGFGLIVAYALTVSSEATQASAALAEQRLSSEDCTSCHDMQEAVESWERSSHSAVECLACHANIAPENWLDRQVSYLRMRLGTGHAPMSVTDERCSSCHAAQMPWVMEDLQPPALTSSGELQLDGYTPEPLTVVAGHDLHLDGDNPMKCVACHGVEGHQESPEVAALSNIPADARANTFHEVCTSCHVSQEAEVSVQSGVVCDSCHHESGTIEPGSHKMNWRQDHGDRALEYANQECVNCHVSERFNEDGVEPLFWVDVTSEQDFCYDCHGVEMPHPEGWMPQHSVQYDEDPELCVTCHGTEPAEFNGEPLVAASELPQSGMCANCHQVDLPHPESWVADHGDVALETASTCETCHSSANPINPAAEYASDTFCVSCHGTEMPHPDDWMGDHGAVALESESGCKTCHSSANPNTGVAYASNTFCVNCHGVEMPHPGMFERSHERVAANNPAACANCHASGSLQSVSLQKMLGQPFCADCHKKAYEHPDLYVLTHGPDVEELGTGWCLTCHGSESFCQSCHTGEEWHPEGWTISHRWAIRKGETTVESCLTCHPTKDPCLKCHDDEPEDFWTSSE